MGGGREQALLQRGRILARHVSGTRLVTSQWSGLQWRAQRSVLGAGAERREYVARCRTL